MSRAWARNSLQHWVAENERTAAQLEKRLTRLGPAWDKTRRDLMTALAGAWESFTDALLLLEADEEDEKRREELGIVIAQMPEGGDPMRGKELPYGVGVTHSFVTVKAEPFEQVEIKGEIVDDGIYRGPPPAQVSVKMVMSSGTGEIVRCPDCKARELERVFIDEDGVLAEISRKPGRWGHTYGDAFWFCPGLEGGWQKDDVNQCRNDTESGWRCDQPAGHFGNCSSMLEGLIA